MSYGFARVARGAAVPAVVGAMVFAAAGSVAEARTLNWSGYTWDVKNATGAGPGPNNWSDSTSNVWVDASGFLHLKVTQVGSSWYCASITCQTALGHGKYEWQVNTNTENLDKNVVFGMFTYKSDTQEIDIEMSRWGVATNYDAQYAVQPSSLSGNKHQFNLGLSGNYATHIFDWEANSIAFQSIHGHYDSSPPGSSIQSWTYTGSSIPAVVGEAPRLNLWLFQGAAPSNGLTQEVVVSSFEFTPSGSLLVPEPASLGLLATGAMALGSRRRRQQPG